MDKTISTINLLESLTEYNGTSSERISETETVFMRICRTCLTETPNQDLANNIFLMNETNGSTITIKDKLQILTGMKISTEDKLPHNICHGCLRLIDAAFSFRVHTQRVDDILKRFIRKIYSSKDAVSPTQQGPVPPSTSVNSEKIDEPTAAIEVEGYQVSFVKDGAISFQCDECNMNFTNQPDLDKHNAEHGSRHGSIRKKLFKCGICSREYSFRNGLHNHLMTAHVQKKEYQCPVCGKMFKKRDRLLQHRKRFCIAPDAVNEVPRETSHITIYPIGDWMNAENIHVEIKNFTCSLCDGKFELEPDFVSHLQEHSAMKKCPYCKKFFDRTPSLESHIRSHTNERPFVCPLCSKGFLAARSFRNHLKLHTRRESYKCETCSKKYISERELIRHLKSHLVEPVSVDLEEYEEAIKMSIKPNGGKEQEKSASTVSVSTVSTRDLTKLSQVKSQRVDDGTHREPEVPSTSLATCNTLSCSSSTQSVCTMEAATAMNFNPSKETIVIKKEIQDILSASGNEAVQSASDQTMWNQPPVGFDIIVKEENSEANHSAFEITNEPLSDDEKLFNQSEQDSTQNASNDLPFGFQYIENEDKSANDGHSTLKVVIDPPIFLNQFEQSKQDPAAECYASFTCIVAECKMEFKYFRDIINHYTSQHCLGPPPFKCAACEALFPIKLDVRTHLKSHITCEYKCPHCPRAYWQLRDLKIHLRTHTGERPFKCTKCPKRFKQRPALKVHIKTHNICKEYKCSICPKEFFSYNGLFLHQKSHEEIKELQCNFCSKQFPTKSRLRRHQNGICAIRTATINI